MLSTKELIKMARKASKDKNPYSHMQEILINEVSASGENYYESPRWIEHEKTILQEIKNENDKRVKKALEGLLL